LVDAASPARRCALLSAALSLFFAQSSPLSDRSGEHTWRNNPDLLLSGAVALWVPCCGVSGRAGDVLPRANGHAAIYRLFHLRRAVWFLLFRGAHLLRLYPRERPGASSGTTGDFSGALRLRAELEGNGGEFAGDRVYLRSSQMSAASRLERVRTAELACGDSGVRRR